MRAVGGVVRPVDEVMKIGAGACEQSSAGTDDLNPAELRLEGDATIEEGIEIGFFLDPVADTAQVLADARKHQIDTPGDARRLLLKRPCHVPGVAYCVSNGVRMLAIGD